MPFYSDIDLSFKPHPITKDVVKKLDYSSILQSFRTLLMMSAEDVLMDPNFDSGIYDLLGEIRNAATDYQLISKIKFLATIYEPRIEIVDINVVNTNDPHEIVLQIIFYYNNKRTPITDYIHLIRNR